MNIQISLLGAVLNRCDALGHSLIFQATTISKAAIAGIGINARNGAKKTNPANTIGVWIMAETGDSAPALTFAADLAMAAVAVFPQFHGRMAQ